MPIHYILTKFNLYIEEEHLDIYNMCAVLYKRLYIVYIKVTLQISLSITLYSVNSEYYSGVHTDID